MRDVFPFEDQEHDFGVSLAAKSRNPVASVQEGLEVPCHDDGRWDDEMAGNDTLVSTREQDGGEEDYDQSFILVQRRDGLSDEESSEHVEPLPL